MLTCIRALNSVYGADILLVGCCLCLIAAFIVAFSIKANRGKANRMISVIVIAVFAAVADLCLYLWFFPNGEYVNKGLYSAVFVIVYPVCLLIGLAVASLINSLRKRTV